VRPASNQIEDLLWQITATIAKGGRVLVTTLTKKMAEDLTTYYQELGLGVRYLHADVTTLDRVALIRKLRQGEFSVLIGINLLREGLDIPEVMLVAVLDADKEGFLRSRSSLIQITGRAARNHQARAIFYADTLTRSIREALDEMDRRRTKQLAYNREHGITPTTVVKAIPDDMALLFGALQAEKPSLSSASSSEALNLEALTTQYQKLTADQLRTLMRRKEKEMKKQASMLRFEQAADIRDEIRLLGVLLLSKD
jgi:excinuclease ABC subunit B